MVKGIVAASVLLVLCGTIAWGGYRLSKSRKYQLLGELVTRVETSDMVVALTFDDGPVPAYTDSVLAVLAEFKAHATFFMVGSAIRNNPDIAARVLEQGHEIGNHSFSHAQLMLKRLSFVSREIEDTDALIRALGYEGEIYVRPPYAKRLLVLPLYLRSHDRPVVLWDLEPDTYHRKADGVVRYVNEHVRPGSIILLHVEIPSRVQNRAALPRILSDLQERGYRFVTLSQLMALRAS